MYTIVYLEVSPPRNFPIYSIQGNYTFIFQVSNTETEGSSPPKPKLDKVLLIADSAHDIYARVRRRIELHVKQDLKAQCEIHQNPTKTQHKIQIF